MFVFVIYAMLVWWGAVRWRRRPAGFACVAIGLVGLIGVAKLHMMLNTWTNGAIYLPAMQVLLYPYIALVVGAGLFIVCLPRTGPVQAHGRSCGHCGYELFGLLADGDESESVRCPECGRVSVSPAQAFANAQRERFAARRLELGRQLGIEPGPGEHLEAGPSGLDSGTAETEMLLAADEPRKHAPRTPGDDQPHERAKHHAELYRA